MAYVLLHDYGNLEDKMRKSSGALFRSDSFFVVGAIHVVITSIHAAPQGERRGGRERKRENVGYSM